MEEPLFLCLRTNNFTCAERDSVKTVGFCSCATSEIEL